MKDLVQNYLDRAGMHLFTNDNKTYMKVLNVKTDHGRVALKVKFGKTFSVTLINVDYTHDESSAGKIYLDRWLKDSFFNNYGEKKYHSVKGGKKYMPMFEFIKESLDKSIPHEGYHEKRKTGEYLAEKLEIYFNEKFTQDEDGWIWKKDSEKVEKV